MLTAVPRHLKITDHFRKNTETDIYSHVEDPRWIFLNAPENRNKQYYVRRGDNMERLGRFTKVDIINNYHSNIRDNYIHYTIWFEIPPSTIINENDDLYYIDELPVNRANIQSGGRILRKKKTKRRIKTTLLFKFYRKN